MRLARRTGVQHGDSTHTAGPRRSPELPLALTCNVTPLPRKNRSNDWGESRRTDTRRLAPRANLHVLTDEALRRQASLRAPRNEARRLYRAERENYLSFSTRAVNRTLNTNAIAVCPKYPIGVNPPIRMAGVSSPSHILSLASGCSPRQQGETTKVSELCPECTGATFHFLAPKTGVISRAVRSRFRWFSTLVG